MTFNRDGQKSRWDRLTPGKRRFTPKHRKNLGESQKEAWAQLSPEEREKRVELSLKALELTKPIPLIPPEICFICGELITMQGNGGDCLHDHSLDGDHGNWDPLNKVSEHSRCHLKFHNEGKTMSEHFIKVTSERMKKNNPMSNPESVEKLSKTLGIFYNTPEGKELQRKRALKQWADMTPEERIEFGRKMSLLTSGDKNPFFNKHHKPESIEKMSKAMLGKEPWNKGKKGVQPCSEETRKKMIKTSQETWDNYTPEERTERGRRTSEGRKRAKIRRENNCQKIDQE